VSSNLMFPNPSLFYSFDQLLLMIKLWTYCSLWDGPPFYNIYQSTSSLLTYLLVSFANLWTIEDRNFQCFSAFFMLNTSRAQ
jgi:hypothetical protein